MRSLSRADIQALPHHDRIRLHNSLLGGKPAHLVGTASAAGVTNLAVFNSACHVSSDPPQLAIMTRPLTVSRDTYRNIQEQGAWTLNAIRRADVAAAHRCAEKLPADQSEFDAHGFEPAWVEGFSAPFVAGSPLQIGLKLVDDIFIPSAGTRLLVGEVVCLQVDEAGLAGDGSVLVEPLDAVSSLGLDAYATVRECARFAHVSQKRR